MNVQHQELNGAIVFQPPVFTDARGTFREIWRADRYRDAGIPQTFVQDNVSVSKRAVLRGLHYQFERAQGKLVSVLSGAIFDVGVDLRPGSPTFGRWISANLSAENGHQLYLPPGFAHGFQAVTDAVILYKCTDYYAPEFDRSLRWDDPDLAIDWPIRDAILSPKDAAAPGLAELQLARE